MLRSVFLLDETGVFVKLDEIMNGSKIQNFLTLTWKHFAKKSYVQLWQKTLYWPGWGKEDSVPFILIFCALLLFFLCVCTLKKNSFKVKHSITKSSISSLLMFSSALPLNRLQKDTSFHMMKNWYFYLNLIKV